MNCTCGHSDTGHCPVWRRSRTNVLKLVRRSYCWDIECECWEYADATN